MTRRYARLGSFFLTLAAGACAGTGQRAVQTAPMQSSTAAPGDQGDSTGALAVQREWWRAFVLADTTQLETYTAPAFSLTLSSGRMYDRAAMLVEAASHTTGSRLRAEWVEETVRFATPMVALVTSRVTETAGSTASTYRYLTVLERHGKGWRVTAAQSTRELAFTPRVPVTAAGSLGDYAGRYRTPRGAALQVVVRDSALALIEPSGLESRMEPVGPGMFEFAHLLLSNGIVRFVFTRAATGQVTALSRLVNGEVTTFPRIR